MQLKMCYKHTHFSMMNKLIIISNPTNTKQYFNGRVYMVATSLIKSNPAICVIPGPFLSLIFENYSL